MADTAHIYPASLWLNVGERNTVVAAGKDDGVWNTEATFTGFSSSNSGIASLRDAHVVNAGAISSLGTAPPNLKEILGVAAGDCTVGVSYSGIAATVPVAVHVNDPTASPVAVITGSATYTKKLGQVLRLNFEESTGVGWLYSQQLVDVDWGDGDHTAGMMSACHCWQQVGTYTVTLTVTNNLGSTSQDTVTVTVEDFDAPTATHNCDTAAEVLTAWDACTGGEEIVLDKAATWTTPITLPLKTFSDFVWIRSNGTLPARGTRITPSDAGECATLGHTSTNDVPLQFTKGQKLVRMSGIEFTTITTAGPTSAGTFYAMCIPRYDVAQSTAADNPEDFILEHILIDLPTNKHIIHGIRNDGHLISMSDSYLGGVTFDGADCQAVFTLDAVGGHCYVNTYFEASGENYMAGGSQNNIDGLVPTDLEFRRCHFKKPLDWMTSELYECKNIFETKNARRVYCEGSTFENHFDGQTSQRYALVPKTAVTSGGDFQPWAISEDVRFENCKILSVYGVISGANDMYPSESVFRGRTPHRIQMVNCFAGPIDPDLTYEPPGTDSRMMALSFLSAFVMDHCLMLQDPTGYQTMYVLSNNNYGLVLKDSIFPLVNATTQYGIFGEGGVSAIRALNYGTGGTTGSTVAKDADAEWQMVGNVVPNYAGGTYPNFGSDLNAYPANFAAVGFEDYQVDGTGDYALDAASTYKNDASDGTDPGPDWTVLDARTATTASGTGWVYESGGGGSGAGHGSKINYALKFV